MSSILIADTLAQRGIDMLSEHHQVEVRAGLSEEELLAAVADVNGLVVRSQTQVTAPVIGAAQRLEVIGRAGVGIDNIDVDAATRVTVEATDELGNVASQGQKLIRGKEIGRASCRERV